MLGSRRGFLKKFIGAALALNWSTVHAKILESGSQLNSQKKNQQRVLRRFNLNENSFGPSPKAMEAVSKGLVKMNRYFRYQETEKVIAEHHNVSPQFVTLGNGSIEILHNLVSGFLEPGDRLIMSQPTYEEMGKFANSFGVEVKKVSLIEKGEHDLDKFEASITPKTRIILICNPNNPTGTITPITKIKKFINRIPRNIVVVIDEAYYHYVEHPEYDTLVGLAVERENIVITRTFSKIYGLAGLRIGYAIANHPITQRIRKFNLRRLPNLSSYYAVPAALSDVEHIRRTRILTEEGKGFFYKEFSKLGFPVSPSLTNHILINLRTDTNSIVKKLAKERILIGNGIDWGLPTYIRISIGTMKENEILMERLKTLFS